MKDINNRILLAEDDPNLGTVLKDSLELEDNYVELFADGEQAWKSFNKDDFDICILDVMMPLKDGFTLAKEIKKVAPKMPIIFLTAKSMKEDKLEGFKLGADDYITKPFSFEELQLRIEAVMRRVNSSILPSQQAEFTLGKYTYVDNDRALKIGDDSTKLTTKEAELLKLLAHNVNKIVDRDVALKSIWGNDNYFTGRSMDVYITKLRKYLKADDRIEIVNIHGQGFKLIVKNS
ncbi:MAG: response regulator transcription factor [Chitinophagales bacterium]|jgi:DNA-binding response OmpR family regulator|nr:response regulator transcription factor [Chitinophagales bacterium]|tara:strand:- start:6229 stop:6930 length:702 start_codon:yes stop_codon:yes gene_type:complete